MTADLRVHQKEQLTVGWKGRLTVDSKGMLRVVLKGRKTEFLLEEPKDILKAFRMAAKKALQKVG